MQQVLWDESFDFWDSLKKKDRIRQPSNGSVSVQFTIINKSENIITEYTKRPWNSCLKDLHLRLIQ
jgi:hypothetical protein